MKHGSKKEGGHFPVIPHFSFCIKKLINFRFYFGHELEICKNNCRLNRKLTFFVQKCSEFFESIHSSVENASDAHMNCHIKNLSYNSLSLEMIALNLTRDDSVYDEIIVHDIKDFEEKVNSEI